MARPKKRPHYDPDKIMKNLLDAESESYDETGELKQMAIGGKESDGAHERTCSLGCSCDNSKVPFPYIIGLPFSDELKKGRNGDYSRELIVDRRSESIFLQSLSLEIVWK